jgi:hypothetical protein
MLINSVIILKNIYLKSIILNIKMIQKLGGKALRHYAIGMKSGVHSAAKFGGKASKTLMEVAPVAGLALGPEVGAPLEAAGLIGKVSSNLIEKATR